jgi:hypothetical protein
VIQNNIGDTQKNRDLFFKVRLSPVFERLAEIRNLFLNSSWSSPLEETWKWNTVFYTSLGKDILYLGINLNSTIKIGFVQGSKLKNQNPLDGQDKRFVRFIHFQGLKKELHLIQKFTAESIEIAHRNETKSKGWDKTTTQSIDKKYPILKSNR